MLQLSNTSIRWAFWLSLPLLIWLSFSQITIKSDISSFLVTRANQSELLLANEMQSGALSKRYLLSIVDPNTPAKAGLQIDQLIRLFRQIPGVNDVWQAEALRARLNDLIPLYAPHAAQFYAISTQNADRLFDRADLSQRAERLKALLLSPQGSLFKNLAQQDPLLLTLDAFRPLIEQFKSAPKADTQSSTLILETEAPGLDAKQQRQIQKQIHSIFTSWNQEQNYQLEMTGVPVFALATQDLIESDVAKLGTLSSLALLVIFLYLFRSLTALAIVSAMLVFATTLSALLTQSLFGYVHGFTLAIGSTLSGVCMDYSLHALVHSQGISEGRRRAAIMQIWPSMAMGAITTSVGYAVLGLSGYPGFKQIAVYAASAILLALLQTRFIMPALIENLSIPSTSQRYSILHAWMRFCERRRSVLQGILVSILVACVWQMPSIRWLNDLQELTPEMDYLKVQDARIRSRISSIEPGRFIALSGANLEEVLQHAEALYPQLERLKAVGKLKNYFGLTPWLLSKASQTQNAALIQKRLNQQVQKDWMEALKATGLSLQLASFNYSNPAPLKLDQLLNSPLKILLENQIFQQDGKVMAMIWLGEHDPEALKDMLKANQQASYFSQRDTLNELSRYYTDQAVLWSSLGFVLILILLGLAYRRILPAIQTLLPSFCASLIIAALWSWTKLPLSFIHLSGFLLAISICDDFGIFYQENRSGEQNLTYQAMGASMLTSAAAFACMAFAETSVLRTLALVVGLGIVIGFLLCPILINPRKHPEEQRA